MQKISTLTLRKLSLERSFRCLDLSKAFPPGHAAVDCEVEGIGEADEHVDEEDDLVRHLVVKELNQAEMCYFGLIYSILHQTFFKAKPFSTEPPASIP